MVYKDNFDDSKDPVYDLRQVYAVELVGEALKDIARARKANNFYMYYECLNDLFIIIRHKFKDKATSLPKYVTLNNLAIVQANQYPNEWLNRSKSPDGCSAIKTVLNDVEMFLYEQMEKSSLFGSNKYIAGL